MAFTINNTLSEIAEAPELYPYSKYMMYSNPYNKKDQMAAGSDMVLSFSSAIGWSPEGIVNGLNFLSQKIASDQTEQFSELDQNGVKCLLEIAPETDHGFGDGTGTNAEGWMDRAFAFIESLQE